MSMVAPGISRGAVELVAQGIHGKSESSTEREFRLHVPIDDQWGRSESLDPDNVGDIADEGMGHRG
jgi:hypothetical protein